MGKIISVVSAKGGGGKTTSACEIVVYYVGQGKRVILVDLDGLQTASKHFHECPWELELTAEDCIRQKKPFSKLKQAIVRINDHLDLLPASQDMNDLNQWSKVGKELQLKTFLEKIRDDYDYIIIDSPGVISAVSAMAILSADEMLIAVALDSKDEGTVLDTVEFMELTCKTFKEEQPKFRVLGTKYSYNMRSVQMVIQNKLSEDWPTEMLRTLIPLKSSIGELSFNKNYDGVDVPETQRICSCRKGIIMSAVTEKARKMMEKAGGGRTRKAHKEAQNSETTIKEISTAVDSELFASELIEAILQAKSIQKIATGEAEEFLAEKRKEVALGWIKPVLLLGHLQKNKKTLIPGQTIETFFIDKGIKKGRLYEYQRVYLFCENLKRMDAYEKVEVRILDQLRADVKERELPPKEIKKALDEAIEGKTKRVIALPSTEKPINNAPKIKWEGKEYDRKLSELKKNEVNFANYSYIQSVPRDKRGRQGPASHSRS